FNPPEIMPYGTNIGGRGSNSPPLEANK
ncbi:MAG: hypothetical protein FD143_3522, partial [Ignavibacteria bacterium]